MTRAVRLPTPQDVRLYWLGNSETSPDDLRGLNKMWFGKSAVIDAEIRLRFGTLVDTLSAGPLAFDWAERSPSDRLAAIIALDQFSRNLFRDSPRAYAQDHLALRLAKDGLTRGEDITMSETARIFFYLPFEHSEDAGDQARAIELFSGLHQSARSGYEELLASTLDYAKRHKEVIDRFGRFPHRNAAVGRTSTPEEKLWLASEGGF
jgi:uncharacterized protein (DUF924 family)